MVREHLYWLVKEQGRGRKDSIFRRVDPEIVERLAPFWQVNLYLLDNADTNQDPFKKKEMVWPFSF